MTGTPGQVVRDGAGARLEFRREFAQPVRTVWAALTEPERLARWFGTWTGEPVVGGTVDLVMLDEGEVRPSPVTILACEPPHRLAVEWGGPGPMTWHIEVTLDGGGGPTTLEFVQPLPSPATAEELGPGWHYYLDRLAASLSGKPMPDWDDYHPALADAYRV
jgi:uncharacterized protein YndB with AHSA1/START domain